MFSALVMAVALSAEPTVSVQFEGTLKDALKEIAAKGHLNLLVAGDLNEHVQVNLSEVSAQEAIASVAKVYGLDLQTEGKMLVVRSKAAAEAVAAVKRVMGPDLPVPAPLPSSADMATRAEAAREDAEQLRARAEAARDHAESVRESMEDLKAAEHDRHEALREATRAQVEAAKAQAAAEKARTGKEFDVVSTGGPIVVTANSRVDSAVAYGGSITLEENAVVEGDAVAMGGDVRLGKNAEIQGDAVAMGGRVILEEGARVHGEQVSLGAVLGTAAARNAMKTSLLPPMKTDDSASAEHPEGTGSRFSLPAFLVNFAFLFAVGFLMLVFAPARMKNIEASIRSQPILNGAIGVGALTLAIPVTVILCITLIGIPIALIGWLLTALAVPVAIAAVANQLGSAVPTGKLRKTQALVLAVGLIIVLLAQYVPYLGPLVLAAVIFVGLGAILRSRFGRPARGTPIIESGYVDSAAAI